MTDRPQTRPNPFIGPRSFRTGEQLYGRDREIEELLDLLIAERIVLLYSPSGTGKTSLVQAALIPRLREEGFQVLPIIRVNTELPPDVFHAPAQEQGSDHTDGVPSRDSAKAATRTIPNRYMLSVIMSLEEETPETLRLSLEERLANPTLAYYLNQRRDLMSMIAQSADRTNTDRDDRLDEPDDEDDDYDDEDSCKEAPEVLIFDQFEEILTADYTDLDAKMAFFKELKDVLRSRDRWALFSMREDFVPSLDPYIRFIPTRFKSTYRLDLLGEEAARQAIHEPALRAGVKLDDAVITRLVNDLRQVNVQHSDGSIEKVPGPYVEPVHLQVVCHRLWQRIPLDVSHVSEDHINQITAFEGVDGALAGYYEDCIGTIVARRGALERRIREWFDTYLISEQGTRGQVMQQVAQTEGLSNEIIDDLIDAHVVRSERRRGITWFELSHDRLVPPIQRSNEAWFAEHLSTLQRQAALWNSQNRLDGLLLSGQALVEAEQWATAHADTLNEVEQVFLAECRQAREHFVQKQRSMQRIRRLAIISAIVSFVACAAMIVAVVSLNRVNKEMTISESQRLAFAAQGVRDNPEFAVLLACESVFRDRNPISEQVLRDSLGRFTWRSIVLHGHTDVVRDALFSPDGSFILSVSNDRTARLWDKQGNLLQTFDGHVGYVVKGIFSPDGQHIVTASSDGTAYVWRTDGTQVATLAGHTAGILDVVVSPDNRFIVTSSLDQTTRIWQMDGTLYATIDGYHVALSPDGKRIVTASFDGTVRLWRRNGTPIAVLKGHTGVVLSVAFSPDGQRIVTSANDKTARVWDSDGTLLLTLEGHTAQVQQALYSPDGKYILTLSLDNTLRLWNDEGAIVVTLQSNFEQVTDAAFDPSRRDIAVSSADTIVRVWRIYEREPVMLSGHTDGVQSVAYSPDGQHLVTASKDTTVRVWERVGSLLPDIRIRSNWVRKVRFSDDGQNIETLLWDGTMQRWDNSGALVDHTAVPENASPDRRKRMISPDGAYVATIDQNRVQIRDDQQTLLTTLTGHTGAIITVAFSPDSQRLVTASWDRTARIWNLDGSLVATLEGHTAGVIDAIFSPDGTYIVTSSNDQTARVWSTNGEERTVLRGHRSAVVDVDISPDSRLIATASWDHTARLWHPDGNPVVFLTGHTDRVISVDFSPDGNRVLTAGQDNVVRQHLVNIEDVIAVAACRVERGLRPDEMEMFGVSEALCDVSQYQCPPAFSWVKGEAYLEQTSSYRPVLWCRGSQSRFSTSWFYCTGRR